MDEIKQKLAAIEEQVSSIKDPALKKIAFERLLDQTIGGAVRKGPLKSTAKRQAKRNGKTQSNLHYSDTLICEDVKRLAISGAWR